MLETSLLKPTLLRKGDTVGIVAPAWTFDPNNFRRGVEKMQSLGYRVKYDRLIFGRYWSLAGHDRERAQQITRMFADQRVRAIFCAKAGYGSIRTIPYLDVGVIRNNPKIFIGYSDITILLAYLQRVAGMVVFHGPVISGEVHEHMNPMTLEYLFRAIGQGRPLGRLRFSSMRRVRPGKARGLLVGGNLSMLISSIGTPYEIDTRDTILFLEDVGESMESLDNYLMHLKLAGKLSEIRGLLMGKLVDRIDYSGKKYSIPHMIEDIFEDRDLPILYGFPSGHRGSEELNITLPLGVQVTLDADNRCVYVEEPAVS
jgi:muramoyltetrapeptide carboxypeptidase